MNSVYHVAKNGNDFWSGTVEKPFRNISKAAEVAQCGDTVIVHEGVYREWVDPHFKGNSENERILYEAAEGEKVVIKGSEIIKGWADNHDGTWSVKIENDFFGDFNPYAVRLYGDWFVYPNDRILHPGEVYMNGKSFYEAGSIEDVRKAERREDGYNPPWTSRPIKIRYPEDTVYQWFASVDETGTTITANFQGKNPNDECVEINVRPYCFYPSRTGIDYITVRGFEMAQAATPWAPPTADQPGLVGPHWSKGWIIENNIIHDSKCCGISLGKEESTGHNEFTTYYQKPGYQYQQEAIFRALKIGWSKDSIGSHIVRNNLIYDCGQNGIVGHMGSAFCEIYRNHIYNIGTKHEFFGYEIAGIKFHAAVDTVIRENCIHNCSLGMWLDWQAQGMRISRNLFYANDRDFFVEVTHGPYIVDNNIFGSPYSFDNAAQGGAFVNNLFSGSTRRINVLDRQTPYHFPHSTSVLGVSIVHSGDDRYYNNIFVGIEKVPEENSACGTVIYNGCHSSYDEYIEDLLSRGYGNQQLYLDVSQPVYISNNAYFFHAYKFNKEANAVEMPDYDPELCFEEVGNEVYMSFKIPEELKEKYSVLHTSKSLGKTRVSNALFDDPNGDPIALDKDYFGTERSEASAIGPLGTIMSGYNRVKVWG